MQKPLNVLFIEDSEVDAELTIAKLEEGGFDVASERVESREGLKDALDRFNWDVVLCDYILPGFSAEEALDQIRSSGQDLPFIITSGAVLAEDAVTLLKKGAHDFMGKNALARLVPAIEREMRDAGIRKNKKRAEQKVKVLSLAVQQSPMAIAITDPNGNIEYVNKKAEEATGYSSKEILGKDLGMFLPEDDREGLVESMMDSLRTNSGWKKTVTVKFKNGELAKAHANISPILDDNNALTHYLLVATRG